MEPLTDKRTMIGKGARIDTSLRFKIVREGRVEEVALGELLTRPTIVSVYMRNNTGSCDRQVTSLVEVAPALEALGWNVVALSRDKPASHLKYAVKQGVRFPLVSDPDDSFSEAADAIIEKSMYGRRFFGPVRAAWLLDRDGRVLATIEKVDTANHAAQLRAVIRSIGR